MNDEMEDVLREFLEESRENLDRVDLDLVALEKDPEARDIVARIFRAIHTIKGTCGFLGFAQLEAVTHAGESLLSALRDQSLSMDPELTSALLRMVDAVRGLLTQIESTGREGDGDYSELTSQLTSFLRREAPAAAAPPPPPAAHATPAPPPAGAAPPGDDGPAEPADVPGRASEPEPSPASSLPPRRAPEQRAPSSPAAQAPAAPTAPAAESAGNGSGGRAAAGGTAAEASNADAAKADTSIRVDVGLLDKLMNLVGELVLARNQIIQFKGAGSDATFFGAKQRLNLITSELQEGVMKTRMQPIGGIWQKFPRIVRDLAASCHKRVRLEMDGEQTELDKTLIEAIKDPLTHLIRNAVDHGVELPEQRLRAGKPEEGCLRLRAYHEGGQVNIEVSDDGAGLDCERVRQKAVERGITTAELAARMSDRELYQLIFLPGFSTATKVTNVSGRGVGMDVVRTNIHRIGGTIELQSQRGAGTTMLIKIPLTLAIIRGVVVTCGDNRYVIPQASVLKLMRLESEEARRSIEMIHDAPVCRLMGKLLPLVRLADVLEQSDSGADDVVNIVVLKADDRHFGVIVHAIQDTEEIVVKPLGKHVKGSAAFAGATIMGDGRVALILDVIGLAQRANVVSEGDERGGAQEASSAPAQQAAERHALLLVRSPGEGRMAIPLSRIERLEEFPRASIEIAGHERVVQYRGSIMPVVSLASLLVERRSASRLENAEQAAPAKPGDSVHVVVCSLDGGNIGILVDEIIDIVEDTLETPRPAGRPGVLGSVVILGRVTELLDVEAALRRAKQLTLASARAAELEMETADVA